MEISRTGSQALQALSQDPIRQALQRPVERLGEQAQSTRVQLSAFGRLRSSVAGVEEAAQGIRKTEQPRSADETRAAAQKFVRAVNSGARVAAELTSAGGRSQPAGPLANDGRARTATNEVRRAVSDFRNNGAEDLRQIGISVGRDGSLTIDQKKFDQALQSDPNAVTQTLDRVGERVETAAARQNSAGGAIGRAVETLSNRVSNLEARRDEAQARAEASQQASQQQAGAVANNPFLTSGIASYRGVFGL